MAAIFISHSSKDLAISDQIRVSLAEMGFERVFLDFDKTSGIGAGENWERRLHEEMTRCHAIILVLTPSWLASKWCFAELVQARALGKVVLPIICEPLGQPGFVLPEIQTVDLIDWNADGVARIQQRLRAIHSELARGFSFPPDRVPYPGIFAFEADDAAIYFGRDEETLGIIERLDARRRYGGARVLIIVGASGAGKSSLLKAGVLPQLVRRRAHWLPLPVIRPEKAPFEALAKAITDTLGRPGEWREWRRRMASADAPHHVSELIKDLRVGEARSATLLISFDQFEEMFTIVNAGERDSFLRLLTALLDPANNLPIMAVATARADVLAGLVESGGLATFTETLPLLAMPLDRIPRLIEGPAAVAALGVEKGLSERIGRDMEGPDALPLLAYTLHLLHLRCSADKRLTIREYLALGDPAADLNPIQNSVRLNADLALASLKPSEGELSALRDAFVPHLVRVRLEDGNRLRQPAHLSDLPQESERLVRALIEARLLTVRASEKGETAIVEVAHEALFNAWPTLATWLDEEQAFLADLERLKGAHNIWTEAATEHKRGALLHGLLLSRARDWLARYPQRFSASGMDALRVFIAESAALEEAERERARRLRRRVLQGALAAAIIFAVTTAAAIWQYLAADRSSRDAITQQKQAERNLDIAKVSADQVAQRIIQLVHRAKLDEGVRQLEHADFVQTLEAINELMERLIRQVPDDRDIEARRASVLIDLAAAYFSLKDFEQARRLAAEGIAIMRKFVQGMPTAAGYYGSDTGNYHVTLATHLRTLGAALRAADDREGALRAYEEALAVIRQLSRPNDYSQILLSTELLTIGKVRLDDGDRAAAFQAYEEALSIARKYLDIQPDSDERRRDWIDIVRSLVQAWIAADDPARALAVKEQLVEVHRIHAAAHSVDAISQTKFLSDLRHLADMRQRATDHAGALVALEEDLSVVRRLASQKDDWARQSDLVQSLGRVAGARRQLNDRAGALASYEESLDIVRRLIKAYVPPTLYQEQLYTTLANVGDLCLELDDRAGSLRAYEEGIDTLRQLIIAHPAELRYNVHLAILLSAASPLSEATQSDRQAREALELVDALSRLGQLRDSDQDWVKPLRERPTTARPAIQ